MNLKIISFNIRCRDDENGHSISERAPRLASIIYKHSPDIIGFQECRPQWEEPLGRFFGEEYEMYNKYRNKTVDIESSPILWKRDKFEFIKSGYFWLSDTPEIESRGWDELFNCFRMCVYVILKEKISGKMFTVMNTHFGFGDFGQVESAKLVYNYSKKVSNFPTFVVGDFNMNMESPGYAEIVKHFTDVNAVTEKDFRDTYHGYDVSKKRNQHIDYCFVDNKITPVSQKILDETFEGKFPSDHFGLLINVAINNE